MKSKAHEAQVPGRKRELVQVSKADWELAEARLAAMERLTGAARLSPGLLEDEARFLGVSRARVYDWLRRYRVNPSIEALLPTRPGPEKGRGRLPAQRQALGALMRSGLAG